MNFDYNKNLCDPTIESDTEHHFQFLQFLSVNLFHGFRQNYQVYHHHQNQNHWSLMVRSKSIDGVNLDEPRSRNLQIPQPIPFIEVQELMMIFLGQLANWVTRPLHCECHHGVELWVPHLISLICVNDDDI